MKKILLIEDDKDQILLYQAKFELEGYGFKSATSGEEGLKMAKSEKPDIILVDLLMAGIGGIEVLRRLKNNPETKDIPVIIVTNLDKPELAEKALSLGALDFIVKSRIPLREMMSRIGNFLK